jgi:hypothetical protein
MLRGEKRRREEQEILGHDGACYSGYMGKSWGRQEKMLRGEKRRKEEKILLRREVQILRRRNLF